MLVLGLLSVSFGGLLRELQIVDEFDLFMENFPLVISPRHSSSSVCTVLRLGQRETKNSSPINLTPT